LKFHPAAQITAWCVLVVILQKMTFAPLLLVASLMLSVTLFLSGRKFFQLLRRTRWVLFSLLLIYAYTTPGQPVFEAFGVFSPSREGCLDGVLQLVRLLSALAALAILLSRLERPQLITGLYTLFAPMQWLGLSRERFAVRLALTLYYAEASMSRRTENWQDGLRSLFEPHDEATEPIELPVSRIAFSDVLLMGGALFLLWLAAR
jgi:energy-coupling factor transport system permease protein